MVERNPEIAAPEKENVVETMKLLLCAGKSSFQEWFLSAGCCPSTVSQYVLNSHTIAQEGHEEGSTLLSFSRQGSQQECRQRSFTLSVLTCLVLCFRQKQKRMAVGQNYVITPSGTLASGDMQFKTCGSFFEYIYIYIYNNILY